MTAIRFATLAAAAGIALAAPATLPAAARTTPPPASNAKPGSAMNSDTFVRTAAMANQFEIESNKVSLQEARGDDVKKFAQEMIDDHTKAGQDMQSALQQASITMPAVQLDKQHQRRCWSGSASRATSISNTCRRR